MSNQSKATGKSNTQDNATSAIELMILPHEKDLGEFTVRRSLPSAQRKMVGPWIFFDHMGPANFAAGSREKYYIAIH
jgi:redox-sensitive bicupin YhaK (pirin superfamily)